PARTCERGETSMKFRPRQSVLYTMALLGALTAPVHAATPSRSMSSYVLLGLDTLNMKEFAFTNLGNVGVNNAGGMMTWGQKSFFQNDSQVVTDILRRAGKKSSMYDLFANTIVSPLAGPGGPVRHEGPPPPPRPRGRKRQINSPPPTPPPPPVGGAGATAQHEAPTPWSPLPLISP